MAGFADGLWFRNVEEGHALVGQPLPDICHFLIVSAYLRHSFRGRVTTFFRALSKLTNLVHAQPQEAFVPEKRRFASPVPDDFKTRAGG
jgi:hypothetical protein